MEIVKLEYRDQFKISEINKLLNQLSSDLPLLNEEDLLSIINNPSATIFTIVESGSLVGMLTLVKSHSPSGIKAWIEDVVVNRASRGKGIAKSLIKVAIDEAEKYGALSVNLTSRPSRTSANQLYVKMGFELRDTNVYKRTLD